MSRVGKESPCCRLLEDLSFTLMSNRVGVSNSLGAVSNLAFDGEDEESGSGKRVDLEVLNLGDFTGEELTDFFFLSLRLDEESDL